MNNNAGNANLSYAVSGPNDSGTVHLVADKEDGKWTFRTLEVTDKSTGKTVNVLQQKRARDPEG